MIKFSSLVKTAATGFAAAATLMAVQASAATQIKIATEGAWPPYNFTDESGNLVGYEVDLIGELCARMPDYECEIVQNDWDGIIPGLLARQYDAIMGDMSITEERMRRVMFSDPYHHLKPLWVGRKGLDISSPVTEADLDGLTVGTQGSTIFSSFMEDNMSSVELKTYGKQDEVELDLVAGRIDMFMADQVLADTFLKSEAGADFVSYGQPEENPAFGIGSGVALRKGEIALQNAFNGAITTVIQDGTMEELWVKWFGFSYTEPEARQ